jgi:hypothetical protein
MENLWTEQGLVNGTIGLVMDIVWEAAEDWTKAPPYAIFVSFDGYTGPTFMDSSAVPIFKASREYIVGSSTYRTGYSSLLRYLMLLLTISHRTLRLRR